MSQEDDSGERDGNSSESTENVPALPEASNDSLMEEWDEADPEDHLPTIPGTAMLDVVQGNVYLWDAECNFGLQYDGELMVREDAEVMKAKA